MAETKLGKVKLPIKRLRAIPGTHQGRTHFIISALEEKIKRRETEWQPTTDRGRRLKAILDKGADERGEPLDAGGIRRELRERRGELH
jgi:hypothetical protein